jgi:hypothetical protein
MFEWYSLLPKIQYPAYAQDLAKEFAEVSTPIPWGPPMSQFSIIT